MDNLLNLIDEEKEKLPSGLYLKLMNNLKKAHDEKGVLVKMYVLKFINRKEGDTFYIDTEEQLYNAEIINLAKYDIPNLEPGREIYYDVREADVALYIYITGKLELDSEEFEYLEYDMSISYMPIPIKFTFTLIV